MNQMSEQERSGRLQLGDQGEMNWGKWGEGMQSGRSEKVEIGEMGAD
jgi:hypothetical protein